MREKIRKILDRLTIFKSLRVIFFIIIFMVGVVPCILLQNGILRNYEERAVEVRVERFKETEKNIHINAIIYVERDSQKGIIIGHQGIALKKVSTEARKALEKFFAKPIFLETFVKVDKDWRSNQRELDSFGYNPE